MSREVSSAVTRALLLSICSTLVACDGRIVSTSGGRPVEDSATKGRPNGPTVAPAPAQLRLLSGREYRATVKDLLDLDVSAGLTHADWSGGFDTGAHGQVQEALFATLSEEAEALASRAVTTSLPAKFPCLAPPEVPDACVRSIITEFGRRAFRRPLTPARVDGLVAYFAAAATLAGNRVDGLQLVIARMLLAPEFLYRSEVGQPTGAGTRTLDAYERASFVSYTLTGSMPDEALLADAERGSLDEATLRGHVRRLWRSPAARTRIAALFRQWLRATALDDMVSRPQDFTKLASPAQGVALRDGFDAYVAAVIFDGKGTLSAALDEPFAMVNQHTAPLVGATATGDTLVRVELPRSERRGLLTQPGLLAALGASGDGDRDRPVMRGYLIKTQLLCESIGPPSGLNTAVAASTAANVPGFAQFTTRRQYEAMMEQGAACSSCHAQFMPLGFAFGRYDGMGRYRTTQRGQTVDASARGVPFLGEPKDFADGLEVSDALAGHEAVAACFTRHLVAWATGLGSAEPATTLAASVSHQRDGKPLELARAVEDVLVHPSNVERVVVDAPVMGGGAAGGGAAGGGVAGGGVAGGGVAGGGAAGGGVAGGGVAGGGVAGGGVAGGGSAGGGAAVTAELVLASGIELRPNESRSAHGRAFTFVYQGDGNLVLYRGATPLWSSGTAGQPAHLVAMQSDGNLVVYSSPNVPIFSTGTNGNPGAQLFLESNGRLVIRGRDGRVLFETAIPPGGTQ